MPFGACPKDGSFAARELKTIHKGALAEGKEPMVHKPGRDYSAKKTFRVVATNRHNNRLDSIKPAHAKRVWSRLERDVFPALGDLLLTKISPPIVRSVIKKIEEREGFSTSAAAPSSASVKCSSLLSQVDFVNLIRLLISGVL